MRESFFNYGPEQAALVECAAQAPASQKRRDAYESHRHRVFALAFYMTGGELEAEDALANTFVRAFAVCDEPSGQQVDSQLVCELSTQMDFEPVQPATAREPLLQSQAASLHGANVKRPDLEEALTELPATERLVFLLRDVEGQDAARVSQTMQLTTAEVNIALLRARLKLRNVLAGTALRRAAQMA